AFARAGELLRRVDDVHRPLLELDRVSAGAVGGRDQLLGQVDVAVVVDPDLGDEVDGQAGPHLAGADAHGPHGSAASTSSQRTWLFVVRASAGSAARSRGPNRPTSSAAMCCASAALPPLPKSQTLPPAASEAEIVPASRAICSSVPGAFLSAWSAAIERSTAA